MNKFYTRKGDDGYTGLLGEGRIPKDHPRAEAIGSIDEANSALGFARVFSQLKENSNIILIIQRDLYNLMAEISATPENAEKFREINSERVAWLEQQTDRLSEQANLPKDFIIPGDSPAGAAMDLARTIVRRAERRVAHLWINGEFENQHVLRYINRLSSLCFVLELLEIQHAGKDRPTLAKGPVQG
jgi:cob(I)alamin adenosyltransferase